MKSYVIDEISAADMEKIRSFLRRYATRSSLNNIFWLQLPDDLLTAMQIGHRECRPHVFAIELGHNWVRLEMFIRSLTGLRCPCQGYCNTQQLNYIIEFAHRMVEKSGIQT